MIYEEWFSILLKELGAITNPALPRPKRWMAVDAFNKAWLDPSIPRGWREKARRYNGFDEELTFVCDLHMGRGAL